MAHWNSPREPGEVRWAGTDSPPADSPAMVTLCGLPPKPPDVVLHPAQGGLLVHQSVVAGRAAGAGGQRGVGQEAQCAEAIVDSNDHAALCRELGSVVVPAGAGDQTATVEPHDHRAVLPVTYALLRVETFRYRQSSLWAPAVADIGCGQLGA
jgi:hypothetical protein